MIQNNNLTPTIGVDAADLCYQRIDGTRIYLQNLLDRFGRIAPQTQFYVYLKGKVNPKLEFERFPNYNVESAYSPLLWTQLKLPKLLRKTRPSVLWMPLHNIPLMRPKETKTVVTVHDLAFKLFPDFFPKKDLFQ